MPVAGGVAGTPLVDVEPGVVVAGAGAGAMVVAVVSVIGVAGVAVRREKRNQMIAITTRMPISHGQKLRPPLRSIGMSAMGHHHFLC